MRRPLPSAAVTPEWETGTVIAIARQVYDTRDFAALPVLADALQEDGCEDEAILTHCGGPGPHVFGRWVIDGCLGKA